MSVVFLTPRRISAKVRNSVLSVYGVLSLTLHANVVNFLSQTGATGTISGAELIPASEASKYNNHWMTGSYLRPFTIEFGAKLPF